MDATFKRLEKGLGPIAEPTSANGTTEAEIEIQYKDMTDYPYSRRYKQLFHQYSFVPKTKRIRKPRQVEESEDQEAELSHYSRVELSIYFNQTAEINKQRKFIWFETYQYRNKQYFIFRDTLDCFSVFDRQMNMRHLIKTQDLADPTQTISSVARQSSSVLFTRTNKIGFLKIAAGEIGPTYCDASHDAILSSASIDYTSSGLVYGLSATT